MTSTENAAWAAQVAAPACTAPTATPYTPPEPEPAERGDVNGPPRRALLLFTVGLVTAAAVVVGVARCGTDDPAPPPDDPAVSAPPAPAAPAVAVSEAAALPYTATDHCPPGSTGPQPLTGGGWWVCVRGSQGAELDGQIIHVTFPEPVVISSVQIVPGAAATTRGGPDEWGRHRVVRVLQYNFCNAGVCVPVVQDTSDGKGGPVPAGPVAKRLARPLLAGEVDVIIQRTDRPTLPTDDPTDMPAPVADVPGGDPVDYTVAVGGLRFFGRPATEQP